MSRMNVDNSMAIIVKMYEMMFEVLNCEKINLLRTNHRWVSQFHTTVAIEKQCAEQILDVVKRVAAAIKRTYFTEVNVIVTTKMVTHSARQQINVFSSHLTLSSTFSLCHFYFHSLYNQRNNKPFVNLSTRVK